MSNPKRKFTNHDKEMLEIMRDPAKWAAHHLGEAPRWYQEQILRHPHHRKVLRCGRRIGKCIEENQRVLDPKTGEYRTVRELMMIQEKGETPSLLTLNDKYHMEESQAFFVEDNGVKPVFAVRTSSGSEVQLTGNHPVLTIDGWVEVDALKPGTRIATPSALPFFGEEEMDEDELKLHAYLIANGYWNGSQLNFRVKSEAVEKEFVEIAKRKEIRIAKKMDQKGVYAILTPLSFELLEDIGEKRVPRSIYSLKREQLALFLNRFSAASGWVSMGKKVEIGFTSFSKQLMIDIKHLFLRFGVESTLTEKPESRAEDQFHYQLKIIRKESVLRFTSDIQVFGVDLSNVEENVLALEGKQHTVPIEIWKYIDEERREKSLSIKQVTEGSGESKFRTSRAPSYAKLKVYAENMQSPFLHDLANSMIVWEEVREITDLGEKQTYDVFVPETHNLIVEDVFVHNTWTMTAHMLWVAFTCNGGTELKKGATCLVATPYDTQAREIFDQLNNFIKSNPILQASVETIRKSPYEIVFKNKSRIKLHTAGTRSGTEGGSLRGGLFWPRSKINPFNCWKLSF